MKFSILLTLALSYTTLSSAQNFRSDNADKAEQLQKQFAKLNKNSPCENNAQACVEDQFAQCVGGKFQLNSCGGGDLKCVALPLVNKPGTSITCSTEADRLARLADARGESPNQSKTPKQGKVKNGKKAPNQGNGKNRKRAPGNEKDGKIPDNEKEGKLPGQDNGKNGKNGKEGNLPGQDNGKDGNDGKLPGQDNGKDGNDEKLPGQDNGKDGNDGNDGKLPGQDNEKCNCKCPNNGNDGNNDGNGKDGNDKDGKEPDNGKDNGNEPEPDNGSEPKPDNGKEPDNGSEPEPDNGDNGKTPPKNDDKLQTPPANGDNNLSAIQKKNIAAAKALQEKFDKLTPNDECNNDEVACVDNKFAQCSGGKFALTDCAAGTVCSALPLVLKEGTTVACTTQADRDARLNPKK